jgi:hypothetical protein
MTLYDPSTGKWYEYSNKTTVGGYDEPIFPGGERRYDPWQVNTTQEITPLNETQSAPSEAPLRLAPGGSASGNYANLTKAQWQDYQRRFVPIENELINSTTYANPQVLTKAIGQGREATNQAMDVSEKTQQRAVGQYGITQDPAQLTLRRRMEGLNRSAAVVDAANRIRQRVSDRNREITSGAAPSSGIQTQGAQ